MPDLWSCGKVRAAVAVLVLAAAPMAAQDTPDFGGRWVLVSRPEPAPDIPRVMSVRPVVARTNVRGEPMKPFVKELTIARELADGTHTETCRVGVVGGVVGIPGGGRYDHRTVWEGRALVMEQVSSSGADPRSGDWTERREVWTLDDDDRLNVVITTSGAAVDSRRVTLVYRRD